MKKYILSLAALSAMTFGLASCQQGGNADELMKQDQEKVNAKVQSMTDELNASMDKACQDKVDSMANVTFASSISTTPDVKKDAKGGTHKPEKHVIGNGKPDLNSGTTKKGTIGTGGKPDLNDKGADSKAKTNTIGNGKPNL